MNCPSRPDEIEEHPDWNQNPQALNGDATTRADLNGIVNTRAHRNAEISTTDSDEQVISCSTPSVEPPETKTKENATVRVSSTGPTDNNDSATPWHSKAFSEVTRSLIKYAQFIGPGFLISVAYIDPGNYATDVAAGASIRYSGLFVILMSNIFAIFLQALCIKLGSVTGLDLAENCRRHLPKYVVWPLYILSEGAIIATDVAEVIGTAIALNLLLKVPLVAGCAISLVDVFLLLIFYNPDGSMSKLRVFEFFVMFLVLGVMVCFCIQLSFIKTPVGEVFRGYIPSSAVVDGNGIYLSCGILGATVMPHSIFLGSGIVQPRLRHFDRQEQPQQVDERVAAYVKSQDLQEKYKPSIKSIRSCLKYSVWELAISLGTFALFINSAILIVAGSSLYNTEAVNADLFGIFDLLKSTISPAAGILFALALLLSGTSAGIVCTMAGQMVSEGMIQWKVRPWVRRLATRTLSIIPSIIIAASIGREGLNAALNASQVALSVALPFVTAPLLWFTCKSSIMTVASDGNGIRVDESETNEAMGKVNMRNGWMVAVLGVAIWLVLVVMNVALIVLAGLGKS